MQKVQLSNDVTSDFTDDPGYMFGFSVTVNPFNGDVCFGQSMGDALYVYDSAGGDYLDMVNTCLLYTSSLHSQTCFLSVENYS